MEAAEKKSAEKPEFAEYDYSNFYYGAGDDPLNLLRPFAEWYREALPDRLLPLLGAALHSRPTTHVRVKNGKTGALARAAQPGLLQLPRASRTGPR